MNFLTIHYFLTLVEERNFTRDAERLHVTQQTLSGHIAMIEREVGMKLFIRHVPLELTDGGEVFYRYARIFQRNELAFRRALSDVSGSESGVLRIGVAPARGEVLLPPLLEAFHRRYPRVRIVLCEMANAMIWKALEREEIDLALARWEEELPGVSLYPYQEEEIVLLLSADLYQRLPGTEEEKSRVLSAPQKELPVFLEPCDFLLTARGISPDVWRGSFSVRPASLRAWRRSLSIWRRCSGSACGDWGRISARKIWPRPCLPRRICKNSTRSLSRKGNI